MDCGSNPSGIPIESLNPHGITESFDLPPPPCAPQRGAAARPLSPGPNGKMGRFSGAVGVDLAGEMGVLG